MRYFIKLENGMPVDHPILESNFIRAFPRIDVGNLPPEFARFVRIEPPLVGTFQVYEGATYEWDGDVVTDVHHIREMTAGERYLLIERLKSNRPNEKWVWSEETLSWIPPAIPDTGGPWKYDLKIQEWVISTEPPYPSWVVSEDGRRYVPPVKLPTSGGPHYWDEEILNWVSVNTEAMQSNG